MMLRCLARILPVLLLASCATPPVDVPESGTVFGIVVDQITGAPLPGTSLVTLPATSSTVTDGQGAFSLSVPSGDYQFIAQRKGYSNRRVSIHVYEGKTSLASLALVPIDSAKTLDPYLETSTDPSSSTGTTVTPPSWTLTRPPEGSSWSRYELHRIRSIDDRHAWACGVLADVEGITSVWTRTGFVLRWDAEQFNWVEESLPDGTGPVEDILSTDSGLWAVALSQGSFRARLLYNDGSGWAIKHSFESVSPTRALSSGSLVSNGRDIFWTLADASVYTWRSGRASPEDVEAIGLVGNKDGSVYGTGGPTFSAGLELISKPLLRRNAMGWSRIGTKVYRSIATDTHGWIWADLFGGRSDTLEVFRNGLKIKTIAGVPFSGPLAPLDTSDVWVASRDSLYHYEGRSFIPALAGNGTILSLAFHRKNSGWMASKAGIHAYR